ncbi:DUF4132 domain-containing protein [Flavilitoribacter nigricans]|uniref:Uncharacterized protein n=1 Tax=Flavilitoribacter nigricans (strain ATCC 23147 / DSM 23189 / NBRC 102662 / NCIMB 1420 / SS-2) TaxID=1122177 RepID=A0A2D0N0L8_FLAN2|nr:DUF4132 domain-containing protein [Flavilitoribacter nigricans]PHN01918.1 hypothetical protein CRP01_34565 [Flavilitoribacter nigricans DSM 23189 = NBRC 102662]
MKFFGRFFLNNLGVIKSNKEAENEEAKQDYRDLILDWFNQSGLSLTEFETDFLEPTIELYRTSKRTSHYFAVKPEEAQSNYFDALSLVYLAFHDPNESFFQKIMICLDDPENKNKFPKEFLSRRHYKSDFPEHLPIWRTILQACGFLEIFNALTFKKLRSRERRSHIERVLREAVYSNGPEVLKAWLDYIDNRAFYEKPQIYLDLLSNAYFQNPAQPIAASADLDQYLMQLIEKAVEEHNSREGFRLHTTILREVQESFLEFQQEEIFRNTPSQKRRFLKVWDFPKAVAAVEHYTGRVETLLEHIMYLTNPGYYFRDVEWFYRELFQMIIDDHRVSKKWMNDLLHWFPDCLSSVVIENVHLPLLQKIAPDIRMGTELHSKVEELVFVKHFSKAGIELIKTIYRAAPEKDLILAHKIQTPHFGNSDFKYGYHNLNWNSDKGNYTKLKAFIADFSLIVPTALKRVVSAYSVDDMTAFQINIDGENININSAVVENFNEILEEKQRAYRIIPIPLLPYTLRDSREYYATAISFLNAEEFNFFRNNYLEPHFPEISDCRIYREMSFPDGSVPSFLEFRQAAQAKRRQTKSSFEKNVNWQWFKQDHIDQLSGKEKWYPLMDLLITCKGSKTPQKKWMEQMNKAIDDFGRDQYFKELTVLITDSIRKDFWFFDVYAQALRGIVWTCTRQNPNDVSLNIVRTIAESSYTKISGVGPRSGRMGNFALQELVNSGSETAFGILNIMRNKTKYQRFIRVLDKYMEKFKEASDIPDELLADRSIPHLGFEGCTKTIQVEDYRVVFELKNQKLVKNWYLGDRKQRGTPAAIKEQFPALEKEIALEFKHTNALVKDLKHRLKTYWLYDRKWSAPDWEQYILAHPLLHMWIEGMIWCNETQDKRFLVLGDQKIDLHGQAVTVEKTDVISFWHPVEAASAELTAWQQKILEEKIPQAERQAYREHYPFSDRELSLTATPRFAGHFLEVRKLMAIANAAGWIFTYVHEDVNWPRVFIKDLNLTAHFKCDYSRLDYAIPTQELFFTEGDTRKITYGKKLEAIPLSRVPAKTRSEICRDIDLFIATTSVAMNPALAEKEPSLGNYRDDFHKGRFSDNAGAAVRKQLIAQLIPRLGLNSPGFEGNYLLVDGKLNQYRINLGSGFAQIRQSQQHLNLMPDIQSVRKDRRVQLPFKDDDTLYLILAKALFLQRDDAVADPAFKTLVTGNN